MENTNEMTIVFDSRPVNEGMARIAAASFCTQLNPTLEVHKIRMDLKLKGREIFVDITDQGVGISDVKKAMEPLYTTKPEKERSGMGFTFMEAFMDEVTVDSEVGVGTSVHMKKTIRR